MKNFIITVLVLLFVAFAIQAKSYTGDAKMKELESNSYLWIGAKESATYKLLIEILKQLNDIEYAIHRGQKFNPDTDLKGDKYPNKRAQ